MESERQAIETTCIQLMSGRSSNSNPNPQNQLRWHKRLGVQRYWRLLERILAMPPAEFRHRLWHKVRPQLASPGASAQAQKKRADRHAAAFVEALGTNPIERISLQLETRFLFGPKQQVSYTDFLSNKLPEAAGRITTLADQICDGKLEIFNTSIDLRPGQTDWQADPCSGRRIWPSIPLREWDAIEESAADIKYVWELNRHQFLPTLGRAYWITGKDRYAQRASELIIDWIHSNPYRLGVNWCSHLEIAVRSISWLWTLPFLIHYPGLGREDLRIWLTSIAHHHFHLIHNLSVYTDPTNHLIGEGTGLWLLSTCLPDLPQAAEQSVRSRELLVSELLRQNEEDGANKERASSYHRFVLDFYLQVLIVARKIGDPLPAESNHRIASMVDFAASLAGSHGLAPMFGDSDDARGIPLPEYSHWDFGDIKLTGAAIFQRADWLSQLDKASEIALWLLGPDETQKCSDMPREYAPQSGKLFPRGGFYFSDLLHQECNAEAVFDVGPLGLWPNASHGHADALSLLIRVNGNFVLTDPGTGTYYSSDAVRNTLRATAAHNTVTVDDLDQADIFGRFKWVNPLKITVEDSWTDHDFCLIQASHDGYHRLRQRVTHRRAVLGIRASAWYVVDHLSGSGQHSITRSFHFPPGVEVRKQGPNSVYAYDSAGGVGLQFTFFDLAPSGIESLAIDNHGIWSDRYGVWQPAARLRLTSTIALPVALCVRISPIVTAPFRSEAGPVATAQILDSQERKLYELTVNDGKSSTREMLLFNPNQNQVELAQRIGSNAELAFVEMDADRSISRMLSKGCGARTLAGDVCMTNTAAQSYSTYMADSGDASSLN